MLHLPCQRPFPDKSPQGTRTQIRTLLGRLKIKSYLSESDWKSHAFSSPIPEWSVGVSLLLASLVHLPNGRSSTEGDKREITVLKGAPECPSYQVPAEETNRAKGGLFPPPKPTFTIAPPIPTRNSRKAPPTLLSPHQETLNLFIPFESFLNTLPSLSIGALSRVPVFISLTLSRKLECPGLETGIEN